MKTKYNKGDSVEMLNIPTTFGTRTNLTGVITDIRTDDLGQPIYEVDGSDGLHYLAREFELKKL